MPARNTRSGANLRAQEAQDNAAGAPEPAPVAQPNRVLPPLASSPSQQPNRYEEELRRENVHLLREIELLRELNHNRNAANQHMQYAANARDAINYEKFLSNHPLKESRMPDEQISEKYKPPDEMNKFLDRFFSFLTIRRLEWVEKFVSECFHLPTHDEPHLAARFKCAVPNSEQELLVEFMKPQGALLQSTRLQQVNLFSDEQQEMLSYVMVGYDIVPSPFNAPKASSFYNYLNSVSMAIFAILQHHLPAHADTFALYKAHHFSGFMALRHFISYASVVSTDRQLARKALISNNITKMVSFSTFSFEPTTLQKYANQLQYISTSAVLYGVQTPDVVLTFKLSLMQTCETLLTSNKDARAIHQASELIKKLETHDLSVLPTSQLAMLISETAIEIQHTRDLFSVKSATDSDVSLAMLAGVDASDSAMLTSTNKKGNDEFLLNQLNSLRRQVELLQTERRARSTSPPLKQPVSPRADSKSPRTARDTLQKQQSKNAAPARTDSTPPRSPRPNPKQIPLSSSNLRARSVQRPSKLQATTDGKSKSKSTDTPSAFQSEPELESEDSDSVDEYQGLHAGLLRESLPSPNRATSQTTFCPSSFQFEQEQQNDMSAFHVTEEAPPSPTGESLPPSRGRSWHS